MDLNIFIVAPFYDKIGTAYIWHTGSKSWWDIRFLSHFNDALYIFICFFNIDDLTDIRDLFEYAEKWYDDFSNESLMFNNDSFIMSHFNESI